MKVITLTSLKGGVGKSALATLIADYLAYYGRVLLIDANRQGDTTKRLFIKKTKKEISLIFHLRKIYLKTFFVRNLLYL